MGLFDAIKKIFTGTASTLSLYSADLTLDERALLNKITKINSTGVAISPELYQKFRDYEMAWLERHYDFNTVEGINAIPVSANTPGAPAPKSPIKGHTGEVYYYLRHKAYKYEEIGRMDLALACMRKSVALVKCRNYYSLEDCYPLVKMLARDGQIEAARKEKNDIDKGYEKQLVRIDTKRAIDTKRSRALIGTDLIIMDAHGATCPECAKYQGRVYSISGKSKKFPKAPDFYYSTGYAHNGCTHNFWPYVDGVSNPDLPYTLSVHPLQNSKYGKDIVTFSNRPFVDDRTYECKQSAATTRQKVAEKQAQQQYCEDHMIEIEAQRGQEARDYRWIQENIPSKCPKSLSGYRRMKTQNTKNYQVLQQMAAELGRNI